MCLNAPDDGGDTIVKYDGSVLLGIYDVPVKNLELVVETGKDPGKQKLTAVIIQ